MIERIARLLAAQYLTYDRELDYLCWARFGITLLTMFVCVTGPIWLTLYFQLEAFDIDMLKSDRLRSGVVVALAGFTLLVLFQLIKTQVRSRAMVIAETMTDKDISRLLRLTLIFCLTFAMFWMMLGFVYVVFRSIAQP